MESAGDPSQPVRLTKRQCNVRKTQTAHAGCIWNSSDFHCLLELATLFRNSEIRVYFLVDQ